MIRMKIYRNCPNIVNIRAWNQFNWVQLIAINWDQLIDWKILESLIN